MTTTKSAGGESRSFNLSEAVNLISPDSARSARKRVGLSATVSMSEMRSQIAKLSVVQMSRLASIEAVKNIFALFVIIVRF